MTPDHWSFLHGRCFPNSRQWSPKEFCVLLNNPQCFVVGNTHSFAMARVVLDECEILTLGTIPEKRRLGFAKDLLKQLETKAQIQGAKRLFLEVAEDNHKALKFYLQCGFEIVATRASYYQKTGCPPVDAHLMAKQLLY